MPVCHFKFPFDFKFKITQENYLSGIFYLTGVSKKSMDELQMFVPPPLFLL